jgi:hypothetical protein
MNSINLMRYSMSPSNLLLPLLFVATCQLAVAGISRAQGQPTLEDRTYDVADLIATARPDNQPDPTAAPLPPDAPIGAQSHTRTEARREFVHIIRESVDPKSWEPDRVPPAVITFIGDKLKVIQSPGNQRAVANLISQLRGDGSEKLQAALEMTRLPRVKFDNTPLARAVQAVSAAANVSVEVDWASFGRISLAPEALASVDLVDPTAARAIRALFDAAAGRDLPLHLDATPKVIRIALDPPSAQEIVTRVYNLQAMPGRACGLDPKKPFTRAQALAALVARINDDAHEQRLREVNGMIIMTASLDAHHRVAMFLDQLDAQAIRARDAKP